MPSLPSPYSFLSTLLPSFLIPYSPLSSPLPPSIHPLFPALRLHLLRPEFGVWALPLTMLFRSTCTLLYVSFSEYLAP